MAGDPDDRFVFGYFFARRHAKHWMAGPRQRPKMPSTPWRIAALCCALTGGLVGWLLFGGGGSASLRIVACAVAGFAIGMYVVETVWERRQTLAGPPTDPIGPRP